MKEDILDKQWQRLEGPLRERWDRLSEDDLEDIHGDREVLLGMLQEYYGLSREQAERELRDWLEAQRAPAAGAGVDPAAEDAYWQASFRSAPYVDPMREYQYYQPAYRFGWESYSRYGRRSFDEVDEALMREWDTRRGSSLQTWSEARDAARDAWERLTRQREPGPRIRQPRRSAGARRTPGAPGSKRSPRTPKGVRNRRRS